MKPRSIDDIDITISQYFFLYRKSDENHLSLCDTPNELKCKKMSKSSTTKSSTERKKNKIKQKQTNKHLRSFTNNCLNDMQHIENYILHNVCAGILRFIVDVARYNRTFQLLDL